MPAVILAANIVSGSARGILDDDQHQLLG